MTKFIESLQTLLRATNEEIAKVRIATATYDEVTTLCDLVLVAKNTEELIKLINKLPK